MRWLIAGALLLTTGLSARAESITIASFADPSVNGTTPVFVFNGTTNQLNGGWIFPGLTLETIGGTFNNATFSMSAAPGAGFGDVGAGSITFRDSGNNPLLNIGFDSAQMNFIGFGATEFLATNNVTFSGPILPFPIESESFSFAFANQQPFGDGFTATAAFTSSAVPEPASLALLAVGGCCLLRRRRRRLTQAA